MKYGCALQRKKTYVIKNGSTRKKKTFKRAACTAVIHVNVHVNELRLLFSLGIGTLRRKQ